MRILLIKLMIPLVMLGILLEPFVGVLFFALISFVRLEVLTWGMLDARFALTTSMVTLCSWLLRVRNPRENAKRIPIQFILYVVVTFTMSLSTVFAEASRRASWESNQKFFKYMVFLFLMIQMINTTKRFRLFQEVLFWGVNFLAVWGTDQYFRGNYRLENVGGGDFADSSGLAALLNLMFPMVIYRYYHPNKWISLSGLLFGPLYLVVLTFTESRSGFLGAVVSLSVMFARARKKTRYLLAAIPIGLALTFVMPAEFTARMETIFSKDDQETGQKRERSADQRLKIWTVAWAVFKDHPILGVGRQNFGRIHGWYAYPIWYGKIDDDLFSDLFHRYRVCHSVVLDILVSNGLATFIPWCLMVISVPYSLSRMRKKLGQRPMDHFWRYQSYGLETGILGCIVTGLFQDLTEIEVLYWAIILGGIMPTVVGEWLKEHPPPPDPNEGKTFEPRPGVSGVVAPDLGEPPLNRWHAP